MEKSKVIEKLFYYIVTSSYLLLPLAFLLTSKGKRDIILALFALYGAIFFFLLFYYFSVPKEYKKLYQTFYTYLEYLFLSAFIYLNIKNKKFKKIIVLLSFLFCLFQAIFYFKTKLIRLDSVPIAIETIIIFVYIIYFFYDSLKNPGTFFIYYHYCFWVVTGIMLYLGGSFFFYILINHLNDSQVEAFGNLTFLTELLKNLFFLLAMFIYKRYPTVSDKKPKQHIPYLDMI